jgi:CRP/FNR family transcriptional regulator
MASDSKYFSTHSVLFREGDPANKLFLIKSGQVICLKSSKERLIPVLLAKGQDIIGESAMLSDAPYTYSAIALTQVETESVDNSKFREILVEAPQWLHDLTITMIARFQSTAGLVAENRVLSASILGEEDFPPALEIEFKKLLSQ